MKKKPVLLMLLGIIAFSLTQSCSSPQSSGEEESSVLDEMVRKPKEKIYVPKEEVWIYLVSVKLLENGDTVKRIGMFDSNGDCDIDSLTTTFIPQEGVQGHIKWKKAHLGGIRKIDTVKFVNESDLAIISQKDVTYQDGEWILTLPKDIPLIREEDIIIKYLLRVITDEGDTLEHDPYIRVPES